MTWNTVLRNMRENKQRKRFIKPALSISWLISVMLISALLLSGCGGQNKISGSKSAQGPAEDTGKIIGKKGKTIIALRSLVGGAAGRLQERVTVEVVD